jgi:hypothetical protein
LFADFWRIVDGLFEKIAAADIAFHASPVQGIEKFRFGEDTSGNHKGKVIFVSHDTSFCSAFGVRWNDTNARLVVETKNQKPPTNSNYKRTVLKITDDIDLDKPCSMYTLRGKFKPLRYEDDIEEYTNDPVEVVAEEKFSTFKEMAKHYGLEIKDVKESTIMRGLKGHKTSNFEKGAKELIDELFKKEAGIASNFLGRNITKAERDAETAAEVLRNSKADLAGKTKSGFLGRTKPMYSGSQINKMTANEQAHANATQANIHKQIGRTFNTRVGAGAVGGGALAYQMQQKQPIQEPEVDPNYNPNYQPDNYMYMSASEVIDDLFEKTAAGVNFSAANGRLGRLGEIATFGAARKAQAGVHHVLGDKTIFNLEALPGFAQNKAFLHKLKGNVKAGTQTQRRINVLDEKLKKVLDPDIGVAADNKLAQKLGPGVLLSNHETRARVGEIRNAARETAKDLNNSKSNEKANLEWASRHVNRDMKALKNYRDNEIAKGLALYGGVGLAGVGAYDITHRQDKAASTIIDELYKEAGIGEVLQAQREFGAAKRALKRMNHRHALAEGNQQTLQKHVDFMTAMSKEPPKRLGKLDEYYNRSQSRLQHSGERVQDATENLNSAKQKRNDEIKNLFPIKRSKEGIPDVL